jgi:hypothetical protein
MSPHYIGFNEHFNLISIFITTFAEHVKSIATQVGQCNQFILLFLYE